MNPYSHRDPRSRRFIQLKASRLRLELILVSLHRTMRRLRTKRHAKQIRRIASNRKVDHEFGRHRRDVPAQKRYTQLAERATVVHRENAETMHLKRHPATNLQYAGTWVLSHCIVSNHTWQALPRRSEGINTLPRLHFFILNDTILHMLAHHSIPLITHLPYKHHVEITRHRHRQLPTRLARPRPTLSTPILKMEHTRSFLRNPKLLSRTRSRHLYRRPIRWTGSCTMGFRDSRICNISLAAFLAEFLSAYPTAAGQYHWVAVMSPKESKRRLS